MQSQESNNWRQKYNGDLSTYNLSELKLLRNEIYARYGRKFKDESLQKYFENQQWYKPNLKYNSKLLTKKDYELIEKIRDLEEQTLSLGEDSFEIDGASEAWHEPDYRYRAVYGLEEKSGNVLKNYQLRFDINTAEMVKEEKMQKNCADISFHDWSGRKMSYWIESGINTEDTIVWVKILKMPANKNTTVYMYYGNKSASSESNGDKTFLFFDDFNSSDLNSAKWNSNLWKNEPTKTEKEETWCNDNPIVATWRNAPTINRKIPITKISIENGVAHLLTATNAHNAWSVRQRIGFNDFWIEFNMGYGNKEDNGVNIGNTKSTKGWSGRAGLPEDNNWYIGEVKWINDSLVKTEYEGTGYKHQEDIKDNIPSPNLSVRVYTANLIWCPGTWYGTYIYSKDETLGQYKRALRSKVLLSNRYDAEIKVDWIFVRNCTDPEPSISYIRTEKKK